MKKSFITGLIILITFSLVGLFSIQIFWIKNSVALRDAQFRRNVKVSLVELNRLLEYEEKLNRLQKHEFGRQIYFQYDSIKSAPSHSNSQSDKNTISEMDTAQSAISELDNSISKSQQSAVDSQKIDLFLKEEQEALENAIRKDNRLANYEIKEIAQLILDLSSVESGSNFLSAYGVNDIDSLIAFTLKEVGGINTEFEFGIFDVYNIPLLIPERSEKHISQLLDEGYKARLLPADYITPTTYLHLWFPNQETYLLKTLWPFLLSSGLFMVTIVLAFGYTIRTILRQKKVSDIKNDFINNITHELKTPISTISLACEALADPTMSASPVKVSKFVKMIKDENKRLGVLVESVLRSAVLDRSEVEMSRDSINLHEIIEMAIQNIELQAKSRGGKIEKSLKAETANIIGDKIHLTNVVFNLLDNAVKYSGETPRIKVTTHNSGTSIVMKVTDYGIGIKKEDQKRIFDKLFRVPTGNVHNIKGFGLGLSYVKAIVEKHHGTVSVQSEFGKGSTFTIQLPFNYEL